MLFTCGLLVLSLSKLSPIRESPVSGIPIVSFFSLVTHACVPVTCDASRAQPSAAPPQQAPATWSWPARWRSWSGCQKNRASTASWAGKAGRPDAAVRSARQHTPALLTDHTSWKDDLRNSQQGSLCTCSPALAFRAEGPSC